MGAIYRCPWVFISTRKGYQVRVAAAAQMSTDIYRFSYLFIDICMRYQIQVAASAVAAGWLGPGHLCGDITQIYHRRHIDL